MTRVYLFCTPGRPGGACRESWHALKLWRRAGVEVTLAPTGPLDPGYDAAIRGLGVSIAEEKYLRLKLPEGAIAVGFCNHPFLRHAPALRKMGCRLVWAPCMNYLVAAEIDDLEAGGLMDAYVFQSRHQEHMLRMPLGAYGARNFHRIPGAFDVAEFPFLPRAHREGEPFVVGRLSRAHPQKFSPRLWEIYGEIPNVRARVLGWSGTIEARCGPPPAWAEVLRVGAETPLAFLRSLHAIVHPGGEAIENWPQFVLEGMAAGVPVVTDDAGGVPEMLDDETGCLCRHTIDMAARARALAENESYRMHVASRARERVEEDLADPEVLWAGWQRVFESLGG
jgi:glycosyltransferase involved in cell wall biosynthesis